MLNEYQFALFSKRNEEQIFLKRQTEALVSEIGLKRACALSFTSEKNLRRYFSLRPEDIDRFIPINKVQQLEAHVISPHITEAMARVVGRKLVATVALDIEEGSGLEPIILKICEQIAPIVSCGIRASSHQKIGADQRAEELDRILALESSLVAMKRYLAKKIYANHA